MKLKRGTYIDDIENHQKKHKAPPVGKYDITKDPYKKKVVNLKPKDPQVKRNTLDDVVYLSNFNPGSGQYNPHVCNFLYSFRFPKQKKIKLLQNFIRRSIKRKRRKGGAYQAQN